MRVALCISALLWCLADDALADSGAVVSLEISTESGSVSAAADGVARAPVASAEDALQLSIDDWPVVCAWLKVLFEYLRLGAY